jgi:hypothetical protein
MSPLAKPFRWAFQIMWLASFLWLAECLSEVLGVRGAGSVLVFWSVPSLPVFVATAEWRARLEGARLAPWVSALVVVWVGLVWWVATTRAVPRSPVQLALATIAVVAGAVGVLAVQGTLLQIPKAAAASLRRRARIAVAAHSGAR